jgi:hypothetical protein
MSKASELKIEISRKTQELNKLKREISELELQLTLLEGDKWRSSTTFTTVNYSTKEAFIYSGQQLDEDA